MTYLRYVMAGLVALNVFCLPWRIDKPRSVLSPLDAAVSIVLNVVLICALVLT